MKVKQFRYSEDNLAYLIHGSKYAMAIDGGAVDNMISFMLEYELELKYVTNTHLHSDHTPGNSVLLGETGAKYLYRDKMIEQGKVDVEDFEVEVFATPGHSRDSVCFALDGMLITGDTLFNFNIGKCFTRDYESFYKSAKKILTFPKETIIYAGHDYVEESLENARRIEPDNPDIDKFYEKYDPKHVFSSLEDEMKINPYLRFNEESIIKLLEEKGLPAETEYERWHSVMLHFN